MLPSSTDQKISRRWWWRLTVWKSVLSSLGRARLLPRSAEIWLVPVLSGALVVLACMDWPSILVLATSEIVLATSLGIAINRCRVSGTLRSWRQPSAGFITQHHTLGSADTPAVSQPCASVFGPEQSEQRLSTILAYLPVGVVITDPHQTDNPIIFVNPAFSTITGYLPEEILGRNCRFLQGPDTDPRVVQEIADAVANLRQFRGTLLNYRKDGTAFWNELIVSPIFDAAGKLTNFVGLQADTTKRKEAEVALQASQAMLQSIIDNMPAVITVQDALESRYLLVNRQLEITTGRSRVDLVGKTLAEIYPPKWANKWRAEDLHVIRTGKVLESDNTVVHADGTTHTWITTKFPLYNGQGNIYAVGGVYIDITEHKRMEEELRNLNSVLEERVAERTANLEQLVRRLEQEVSERQRAEEALRISESNNRALLNAIPDAIVRLSSQGRVLSYKPARDSVPLLLTDDCIGQDLASIMPTLLAQRLHRCITKALATDTPQVLEYMQPQRLGEYLIADGIITPEQLLHALQLQLHGEAEAHLPLGDILVRCGMISTDLLNMVLERQQAHGAIRDFEARIMPSGPNEVLVMVRDITDRKRAEDQLLRQSARTAVFAELARALEQAALDYQQVLVTLAQHITTKLNLACVISLISADKRFLEPVAFHHPDANHIAHWRKLIKHLRWPIDDEAVQKIIQTGKPILISAQQASDMRALVPPAYWSYLEHSQTNALIAVPLRAHGETIGTMALIQVGAGRLYIADDQAFLQELADRAALAIDNASLFQEAQQELAERRRAEESIRFQAHLLNTVNQAVIATDLEGTIIYWNRFAEELYGWSAQEAIGRTIASIIPSGMSQEQGLEIMQRLRQGESWSGEFMMQTRQGCIFPALVTDAPIYDKAGQLIGIVGVSMDISERKRAEESLNEANVRLAALNHDLSRSRDLLRVLFDGIQDGLVLLDRKGTVLAANHSMAALFGLPDDFIVGQPWVALCQRLSPPFPALLGPEVLHEGITTHERKRVACADAKLHVLDIQILPLTGMEHTVDRVIVHVVDVTEQLQLEAQVIEQERFAANGRLAAIVAHEVNTPLQAVETCLHLAGRVNETERGEYLRLARDEIHRAGNILRQLLDLYRPTIGAGGPIDINALIGRVLMLTGATLTKQQIRVERDLAPDLPPIWGRADELSQVLLNLVVNAAHAMPTGGHLRLRTSLSQAPTQPRFLVIEVEDTGAGMSQEVQERIFEPFFTTKANGTGLGLAISRKIIATYGGTINVKSMLGVGSTFTLTLVLNTEADAE